MPMRSPRPLAACRRRHMQMYLRGSEPFSAAVRGFAVLARPAPGAGFRRATRIAMGVVMTNSDNHLWAWPLHAQGHRHLNKSKGETP
jgi:hypothetical protein